MNSSAPWGWRFLDSRILPSERLKRKLFLHFTDLPSRGHPVEHDSPTVLVLLALRQLGGQAVPAKHDLFTKGLKKELQLAIDSGQVTKEKIKIDAIGPNGKPKKS